MSLEPSNNNDPSDPSNKDSLDNKVNELSGFKRKFLSFSVVLIITALTLTVLNYTINSPKENTQIEQERQIKLKAEQAKIEKERTTAVADALLKDKERLKQIKQDSIACESAIKEKRWELAEKFIVGLQDNKHGLTETSKLQARVDQGKDEELKNTAKINTLLEQAKRLDTGRYSKNTMRLLDQALALDPDHSEVTKLRDKINAYNTEFRIPEDAATIAELIPKLRAGDSIILGKGTYNFSAQLDTPVTITGAGIGQTIIECDTTKQSAFVFQSGEKPYQLSDVTVRGTTYQDFNIDRHPLILVKAQATIKNVVIEMSSGHGIAVLSGSLTLSDSEITANGWDGLSIRGEGSTAHIKKCKIHTNYDHGVDFWKDATGSISESEIYENSGSGVVVMGKKANVKITQVRSFKNEQCGIVVMDKATINLARVVTASNVLSGIAVQGEGTKSTFGMVISNNNKEAGYYLDPASTISGHEHTTSEGNAKGNTVSKALEYSIERKDQ